jgi:2-polyprenyl-3-methyl-5-hydroxy-6-metoxy-1,4-benzoquinol methylase
MLDVLEHLGSPEAFIESLHVAMSGKGGRLIISTGNVGFVIVRLMLLLGQFNYGKRGILDVTHKRLLTFASLRRLLEQGGFRIVSVRGIAAPFPLALGEGWLGRAAVAVNRFLIGLWKALFSYQILMVAEPRPTVESLLDRAIQESERRNSS